MTVVDKLNLAEDERNAPVWRELLPNANKPTICWDLDAARWKAMLYQSAPLASPQLCAGSSRIGR